MEIAVFQQLVVAVALGSLIGLERERRKAVFGGIRTFALISLLGALAYLLAGELDLVFAVVTLGFIGMLIVAYFLSSKSGDFVGLTSEVAAVLMYFVGVLAGKEEYFLAVSVSLMLLAILYFKEPLHLFAKKVQQEEILATLQFMIIAFVILPILPNESFGPYGFLNPYLLWLMVVFISGISFASYLAIKIMGHRKGIFLSGFLAGFISSTALAFSFSERSKNDKKVVNPYVLAILVASTAMFFRVLIEVAVVNRDLLGMLAWPVGAMGVSGILIAIYLYFQKEKEAKNLSKDVENLKSPFALKPALKFGFLFALVLFLSSAANDFFGERGVYATSVISGLMDVDAITISMANLANEGSLEPGVAVNAITIAAIMNTLSKAGILLLFGGKKVAYRVASLLTLMVLVGAGVLIAV